MNYVIKKGRHYASPFIWPSIYLKSNPNIINVSKIVTFDKSVKYDIDTDQSDINKLFGISYGHHHYQSDRIGWRYVPEKDSVELLLYSYELGNVRKHHLCYIEYDTPCIVALSVNIDVEAEFRSVFVKISGTSHKNIKEPNLNMGYNFPIAMFNHKNNEK